MARQEQYAVAEPKLPGALAVREITGGLHDDDMISDCVIERCVLSGKAQRLGVARAMLRGVRVAAEMHAAEFEDVVFDGCDLSNVNLGDAILLRVCFRHCRMTGADFSGAVLRDCAVEDGAAQYANFRFARFERASFTGCGCADGDFGGASFRHVRFAATDLRRAQMSGVSLDGIDFTSCDIDGLGARPEDLRGAVFTPEQAVTAAKILGVQIRF